MIFSLSVLACLTIQQVDNPAYSSWSSFKPGSWAKLKFETRINGQLRAEGESLFTLKSIDANAITLELKSSTIFNGRKLEMKPEEMQIPANSAQRTIPLKQ